MEPSTSINCTYVPWDHYNWHDTIQCNQHNSGIKLHWNPAVFCLLAASHAVSVYTCLELIFRTFLTFKRWRTLYFWSLLITLCGLIIVVIAWDLRLFVLKTNNSILAAVGGVGWVLFKTGYALVLYSRLYLVIPPARKLVLRLVLISIVISSLGIHVPEATATIIMYIHPSKRGLELYNVISWIAITFRVQVYILLGLYMFYFRAYFTATEAEIHGNVQNYINNTYYFLIATFFVTFTGETPVMILQYKRLEVGRLIVMCPVYMAVLSFELYILERLLKVSTLRTNLLQRGNLSANFAEEQTVTSRAPEIPKRLIESDTVKQSNHQVGINRHDVEDLERQC